MADKAVNRYAREVRKEDPLGLAFSLAPSARTGVALFAVRLAANLEQELDFEKALARDEQQLNIDFGNDILIQRFSGIDLVVCGKGE